MVTGVDVDKEFAGVADGIRECLRAFRDSGMKTVHYPRTDAYFDRICGERSERIMIRVRTN